MLLALLLLLPRVVDRQPPARRVTYSSFLAHLDSGHVTRVDVGEGEIRGVARTLPSGAESAFVTTRVAHPELIDDLRRKGVEFAGVPTAGMRGTLLWWIVPAAVFFAIWVALARRVTRQQEAGLLGIGRSGARVYAEQETKVTFADVAGVDEATAELQELVAFLRDPGRFGRLGARMPKGVLLVGPPGTGKTLLARAVAGEAGVPFYSINGSEFVELFVGVGAARVRDLFRRAREHAPCIIFIDEIDALGRTRAGGLIPGASDEKEQTLNQLLAELDGFNPEGGVVLLAATNRPEILDPALLRAGRFDRRIVVDPPDRVGRRRILDVHVRRVTLAGDLDLDQVAGLTPGFTGADLANLVNEAALVATRRGATSVSLEDFSAAVERIVAGLARRSRVLSPREREASAYHEMGHALVALGTPGADPVQKVSIIPRTMGALGYTLQRPAEDRYIATRAELEGKLTVLLGGRAGELVAFHELSTGAADDLARATDLARAMVTRFGMDETVGHVTYGDAGVGGSASWSVDGGGRQASAETARDIDLAVRAIVERALDRAVAILTLNGKALETGARLLLERESLSRDQLPPVTPPPVEPATAVPRRVPLPAPVGA